MSGTPEILFTDNAELSRRWLEDLVKRKVILSGRVLLEDIRNLSPLQCAPYDQVHLFAGIAGWSEALRIAGWPLLKPVWTGSCPCPPFSTAGRSKCPKCGSKDLQFFESTESSLEEFGCDECGWTDDRNPWPEMRRLVDECRPTTIFGEQVASPLGREWLARVRVDLETLGYVVGAADLCAASVAAPHIRQRLFWVADRSHRFRRPGVVREETGTRTTSERRIGSSSGCGPGPFPRTGYRDAGGRFVRYETDCGVGNADGARSTGDGFASFGAQTKAARPGSEHGCFGDVAIAPSPIDGTGRELNADAAARFWNGSVLIDCADGKARRIEPQISPLVDGFQSRVDLISGIGNAIVPWIAAIFISSFLEAIGVEHQPNPSLVWHVENAQRLERERLERIATGKLIL